MAKTVIKSSWVIEIIRGGKGGGGGGGERGRLICRCLDRIDRFK